MFDLKPIIVCFFSSGNICVHHYLVRFMTTAKLNLCRRHQSSYLGPGQKGPGQLRDQQQAGAPSGPQGDRVQPFFLMWPLHPMADRSIVRRVDGASSITHMHTGAHARARAHTHPHTHTAAGQDLTTQIVQNSTSLLYFGKQSIIANIRSKPLMVGYRFMLALLTDGNKRLQNTILLQANKL